jgi:hypothetical protein
LALSVPLARFTSRIGGGSAFFVRRLRAPIFMKFTLEIGEKEKHRIDYSRNWFFGTERLRADGELVASRSVVSPSNYISFPLCRRYEFSIGTSEPHTVVFEKARPLLFAGFRPHKYRVLVDGKLVHEQEGF